MCKCNMKFKDLEAKNFFDDSLRLISFDYYDQTKCLVKLITKTLYL